MYITNIGVDVLMSGQKGSLSDYTTTKPFPNLGTCLNPVCATPFPRDNTIRRKLRLVIFPITRMLDIIPYARSFSQHKPT